MARHTEFENMENEDRLQSERTLRDRPVLYEASSTQKVVQGTTMRFKCEICPFESFNLNRFQNHIQVTHRVNLKQCLPCNKVFTNSSSFETHMASHERSYTCIYCEKKFKCKSALSKHTNTHICVLDFKCDICSKAFKTKDTLKRHLGSVHNISPAMTRQHHTNM